MSNVHQKATKKETQVLQKRDSTDREAIKCFGKQKQPCAVSNNTRDQLGRGDRSNKAKNLCLTH
ncbi:hypothetical protein [Scytonema sp. PCC 10023]|uniref:hypothetical protein n=1 Tax=Scytonema sp. PCC 10023 TaxID=1680591 RepID=UPI0039C5C253